jgi:hypothetical protein
LFTRRRNRRRKHAGETNGKRAELGPLVPRYMVDYLDVQFREIDSTRERASLRKMSTDSVTRHT